MNVLYHHRTRARDVEGVHIRGIVGALEARGHRVDVVGPPGVHLAMNGPPGAKAPSPPRVAPRAAAGLWGPLSRVAPEPLFEAAEIAYNGFALPVIEARLAATPFDLVYERYALFLGAGVLAARRHGVPIVLEVNDSARLDRIRPLHWSVAARRAEDFIWRSADAVITVTDYFRDLIVEAGVERARVHVLANAVDDAQLAPPEGVEAVRRRHDLAGRRVIGYVGALNRWRRLDLLVAAFTAVAPRFPDAVLLVVGDGPDRAALSEQAASLDRAGRVRFAGAVPHDEVAAYIAACDVAVLPHSNVFGSPMKLFEYMAAGRAVLAPRLPPIVPVLADQGMGAAGLVFPPLDAEALGRALETLLAEPALRSRLGREARARVAREHTWSRHAALIESLAAGGGRASAPVEAGALKRGAA